MTPLHIIFYLFSFLAVGSALMVVAARNSVHGVLFLVLTFFSMAGIWIMLHAEFLALILVLVYVGAVMTLFLFVVMMLRVKVEATQRGLVRYFPIAVLAVVVIMGLIMMVIAPKQDGLAPPMTPPADYNNTTDLGSVLYTNYAYPFEVAGVLLLTAIIAAICLAHRAPKQRKVENIAKQIAVKAKDRMKLVNLPSEKKYKPGSPQ